jgi:hypothetical protein
MEERRRHETKKWSIRQHTSAYVSIRQNTSAYAYADVYDFEKSGVTIRGKIQLKIIVSYLHYLEARHQKNKKNEIEGSRNAMHLTSERNFLRIR